MFDGVCQPVASRTRLDELRGRLAAAAALAHQGPRQLRQHTRLLNELYDAEAVVGMLPLLRRERDRLRDLLTHLRGRPGVERSMYAAQFAEAEAHIRQAEYWRTIS